MSDVQGTGSTVILSTVTGLQGRPVAATPPMPNQLLQYNGTQWIPATVSTGSGTGSGTVGSGTGPQLAQYAAGTGTTVGGMTLSGDATIAQGGALTLANSGAAAGTYNNLTINAKGLATAGSNVAYLTAAVTSLTAGAGITLTPATITGTGTIALTSPVTVANGGTGQTTALVNSGTVNQTAYYSAATSLSSSAGLTLSGTAVTGMTMGLTGTAVGDIYYAGTGGALTRLGAGTATYVLTSNGAATAPSWTAPGGGAVSLTAGAGITLTPATITGTGTIALTSPVVVANGGTGLTSGTSGGVPYYSTTTAITSSAALGAGLVVTGGGAGAAPATIANGQLPATATNDNAAAGKIGEYISGDVLLASAFNIVVNTVTNVTQITLTAGDWDVDGVFYLNPAGTTVIQGCFGGITATSITLPDSSWLARWVGSSTGQGIGVTVPPQRLSLSATATYYLVASTAFTTSTCTVCGHLRARRVR